MKRKLSTFAFLKSRRDEILAVAKKHGVKGVRVFGSVARGEDRPGSDIDLLVDINPKTSAFDLMDLRKALETLLGRSVDVVTEKGMFWYIRDKALASAIRL